MKYIIILLLPLIITSCNVCNYAARKCPIVPDTIIQVERYTTRDTLVLAAKEDSTVILAWLECDSLGQVLIRELDVTDGMRLSTEILLKNNKLKVRVYSDSIQSLWRIIEKERTRITYVTHPMDKILKSDNEKLLKKLNRNKKYLKFGFVFACCLLLGFWIWGRLRK